MYPDIALCAVSGERSAKKIPIFPENDQPDLAAELAAARHRIADLERTLNGLSGFTVDDNVWMQKVTAGEVRELALSEAVANRDLQIKRLNKTIDELQGHVRDLITKNTELVAKSARNEVGVTGVGGIRKDTSLHRVETYWDRVGAEDRADREVKRKQHAADRDAWEKIMRAKNAAWRR